MINAALYLRRPLLVTGSPGAGKMTLAHSVAYELRRGDVPRRFIVSRSTLQDGLYRAGRYGAAVGGPGAVEAIGNTSTSVRSAPRCRRPALRTCC